MSSSDGFKDLDIVEDDDFVKMDISEKSKDTIVNIACLWSLSTLLFSIIVYDVTNNDPSSIIFAIGIATFLSYAYHYHLTSNLQN